LGPAQGAVQSCHAAIEASREFIDPSMDHPHLVLLEVRNESRLQKLHHELKTEDIPHVQFIEPDLGDSLTAIAVKPTNNPEIRKYFSRFQLFKGALNAN